MDILRLSRARSTRHRPSHVRLSIPCSDRSKVRRMSSINDLFSVRGLHVLITGGGSGLGQMMAKGFAKNGAHVIIAGRRAEKLGETQRIIHEAMPDASVQCVPVDLASDSAVTTILEALGPTPKLDVLINCAGIAIPDPPSSDKLPLASLQAAMSASDPVSWTSQFSTNVHAPYALTVGLMHLLSASPTHGRVINFSSIGAIMADPNVYQPAYHVSKAAVDHLTRILASKFRQLGIRVNAIAPGYFPSEMNDAQDPRSMVGRSEELVPVKRAGNEDDIAGTAIWLASPAGDYVNGQVIVVDGGRSWAWVQMA